MSTLTSLTLAEELLLVALDDERGTLLPLPPFSMEVASAAALVMEEAIFIDDSVRVSGASSLIAGSAGLSGAVSRGMVSGRSLE